ncbi:hypothetical protein B0I08_11219 [Glaciihabitans tibetensis]|uniref:ABC-2 family transporter n=1 Tax=Glaciihabitans tibetensis TaxID=1266600 RepID=A0A2T0V382_9MICO|nr:hypothetical protein [Glaciihabitans tibetensis]PRY64635.1 hypothetical protein B0I08_11219 [Glaciihabitans tibetensis]
MPALASGQIGPGAAALGDDFPTLDLSTASGQLSALNPLGTASGGGSIGIAVITIVLLGVLAGTSDYRFGGIVTTALAQPRRGRILTAKAAAMGIVGLLTGVVFAVVSLAALLATLVLTGTPLVVEPSVAQLVTGVLPVWAELLPLSLATSVIGTGASGLSLPLAGGVLIALTGVDLAAAGVALRRRDV